MKTSRIIAAIAFIMMAGVAMGSSLSSPWSNYYVVDDPLVAATVESYYPANAPVQLGDWRPPEYHSLSWSLSMALIVARNNDVMTALGYNIRPVI